MSGLSTSEMKEYKNNFVGNGPYKIKKYEDRQYIILERNEDYFGDLCENGTRQRISNRNGTCLR